MGASFSNVQVRAEDADAVAQTLLKVLKAPAYVSAAHGGWVSVFCDTGQDEDKLAKSLSRRLSAAVFLLTVHDSDIFLYTLYKSGKKTDEYDSCPDYFEEVSKAKKARLYGRADLVLPFCIPETTLVDVESVLHPATVFLPEPDESAPPLLVPDAIVRLAGLAGLSPESFMRQVTEKMDGSMEGTFTFAEDQTRAFAVLLGMDEGLSCASFGAVGDEEFIEEYPDDQFQLVGSFTLPQTHLDDKLRDALSYLDFNKAREWINKGANINHLYYGLPLLVEKVHYYDPSTLAFLLEMGADPNIATMHVHLNGLEGGMTALMEAAAIGKVHGITLERRMEILRLLLNAGADVNAISETGKTALKLAHGTIIPEQAEMFRLMGYDIQKMVSEQSPAVVQLLREAGAKE